jgi:hypothetical protein
VAASISTVLALLVAVVAWLFPRTPDTQAATGASRLRTVVTSGGPSTVASAVQSTKSSPSLADTSKYPVVYEQERLQLSDCAAIDLDEPRVLPTLGADVTYHCIDQKFMLTSDAVGGSVDADSPSSPATCMQRIRLAGFEMSSPRISRGFRFCVLTSRREADLQGITQKIVLIQMLTDGFTRPVEFTVSAWVVPPT